MEYPQSEGLDVFSDYLTEPTYDEVPLPQATSYDPNNLPSTSSYDQTNPYPAQQQWSAAPGNTFAGQEYLYPLDQSAYYAPNYAQPMTWQQPFYPDASQPLSASTSYESIATSHGIVSPVDSFAPTPTSMDPMILHQGNQAPMAPGTAYPYAFYPQPDQYMYPPYGAAYPVAPPLVPTPPVNAAVPIQATSVPLSRTSSRSSSDRTTKKTLTALQRQQICTMAAQGDGVHSLTQQQIAFHFGVDRSTISKVVKQGKERSERLANNIPDDPAVKAPRSGNPRFQAIEDNLGAWLDLQLAQGKPVPDSALTERAREIAAEQRNDTFKCSAKWVTMFKQRRTESGKLNKPLFCESVSAQQTPHASPLPPAYPVGPIAGPSSRLTYNPTPPPAPGHYPQHPSYIPARGHTSRASLDGTRPEGRARSNTLDTAKPLSSRPRLQRHQSSASVDWRKKSMGASALGLTTSFGLTRISEVPTPQLAPQPVRVSRPPMHARARSDVVSSGWGRALGMTPEMSEGDARSVNTPLDTPANSHGLVLSSLPVPTIDGQRPKKRSRVSLASADFPSEHGQQYIPYPMSQQVWAAGSQ